MGAKRRLHATRQQRAPEEIALGMGEVVEKREED
jgi:hypothetical protein